MPSSIGLMFSFYFIYILREWGMILFQHMSTHFCCSTIFQQLLKHTLLWRAHSADGCVCKEHQSAPTTSVVVHFAYNYFWPLAEFVTTLQWPDSVLPQWENHFRRESSAQKVNPKHGKHGCRTHWETVMPSRREEATPRTEDAEESQQLYGGQQVLLWF